jgi:hypothetical protein
VNGQTGALTWTIAGLITVVGGCASEVPDVASISGQSNVAAVDNARQRATAESMAQCLVNGSVDAVTRELEDGPRQLMVLPANDGPLWQLCWGDGCTLGGGQDLPAEDVRATVMHFEELGAARDLDNPTPGSIRWLIIDGVDRTETWTDCATATGYSRPNYFEDRAIELQRKARIAEAGAEWAACARENGFPNALDPDAPVADNWKTEPSAVLPGAITAEQLRALLAACPAFDVSARAEADLALAQNPDLPDAEYWRIAGENPSISFDLPCLDRSNEDCVDANLDQELRLYQVLEEEQNRYLEQLNANPPTLSDD